MTAYPASLSIDYSERSDRLTVFFRLILIIPILIILGLLTGPAGHQHESGDPGHSFWLGGLVFVPALLMILFRKKYPRWWFDWNLAFMRFFTRVWAYFLLLTDEYPSTDEDQAVHLDIAYPDAKNDLNRWLPLVKWLLAIPHVIALLFLDIMLFFCTVIAWWAILFVGRYPKVMFDFAVGVLRWGLRVCAYCLILSTDKYPPFRLE